eukprot:11218440-Lingulodinium_polyedra.AAC.1
MATMVDECNLALFDSHKEPKEVVTKLDEGYITDLKYRRKPAECWEGMELDGIWGMAVKQEHGQEGGAATGAFQ